MTGETGKTLTLDVEELPGAVVVHAHGAAVMGQADKLLSVLEGLTDRHTPIIVLDLADLDFVSSAGLSAIIMGHVKSRHHQGQLRLASPSPHVREVLELTRLTKLFDIYPSVQEATAS